MNGDKKKRGIERREREDYTEKKRGEKKEEQDWSADKTTHERKERVDGERKVDGEKPNNSALERQRTCFDFWRKGKREWRIESWLMRKNETNGETDRGRGG